MIVEHGADARGRTIAVIDNRFTLLCNQTAVSMFRVGDKIGTGEDGLWIGTIVISEPSPEGWHLAWMVYSEPRNVYHWRGRETSRDTRWTPNVLYEIEELP